MGKLTLQDIERIEAACEGVTPGPWTWAIEDVSMATLGTAPYPDTGHVMSVSPCRSCTERAKASNSEWQWGRCMTPKEPDARHIANCDPSTILALCELARAAIKAAEASI